MKLIVTGVAGFIGMHTARRLLEPGHEVVGIDNLNDYYDIRLKQDRLEKLTHIPGFRFSHLDISDDVGLNRLFERERPARVIHLAAQAGVRYSLENPKAYVHSNLVGFASVLEACRRHQVEHLVYGSSSSVYGNNSSLPSSEHDPVDHPLSLYAASKRSNELMAHSYANLFDLPATGLRFFTVYGPWGRPDMAPILFARAICEGRAIEVFNQGNHRRDFTYIDDSVSGILAVTLGEPPVKADPGGAANDPATSSTPFRLFNVGNSTPVKLLDFIRLLEKHLGKKARLQLVEGQPGDVQDTWADSGDLERACGYRPNTSLDDGVKRFVGWFRDYYRV